MKRRLFNLAAAVSLVLCVATAALWVRSYRTADQLILLGPPSPQRIAAVQCYVRSANGGLGVALPRGSRLGIVVPSAEATPRRCRWITAPASRSDYGFHGGARRWHGFAASYEGIDSPPTVPLYWKSTIPYWAVEFLAGMPLIIWTIRRPTGRAGHCATCGYDLRATPDRCPECGTAATMERTKT